MFEPRVAVQAPTVCEPGGSRPGPAACALPPRAGRAAGPRWLALIVASLCAACGEAKPPPEPGATLDGSARLRPGREREDPGWAAVAPWARPLVSSAQVEEAGRWGVPVAFETRIAGLGAEPQIRFVLVPAGRFRVGSSQAEEGREPDEAVYEATLARPYYVSIHEVTLAQYHAMDPRHDPGAYRGQPVAGARHPVVGVTPACARAFARWLSEHDGLGHTYRLPTEEEWERAARGGTEWPRRFWWGDSEAEAGRYANLADRSARKAYPLWWTFETTDGHVLTAPVGSYEPNGYGLYDVLGNAWELCERSDGPTGQRRRGPGRRPGAFLRGGAFDTPPTLARLSYRSPYDPSYTRINVGFRLLSPLD